jgi:hypothetical protein
MYRFFSSTLDVGLHGGGRPLIGIMMIWSSETVRARARMHASEFSIVL